MTMTIKKSEYQERYERLNEILNYLKDDCFDGILLNPFFWLYSSSVGSAACSPFFVAEEVKWRAVIYRVLYTIWMLLNNIVRKVISQRFVYYGKFKMGTKVFIYTWFYKKDLNSFLNSGCNYNYIWGDLCLRLKDKNISYQLIVQPLFAPTSTEIDQLVKAGAIVLEGRSCFSFYALWKSASLLKGTWRKICKFAHGYSGFISYCTSFLNVSFLYALDLNRILRKELKESNALFLLPWEGQPEHRALCEAFRGAGMKVYGYVHGIDVNMAMFAKYDSSANGKYFPDLLLAHGDDICEMLKYYGWENDDIIHVRTVRFKKRSTESFEGKLFFPYSFEKTSKAITLAKQLAAEGRIRVKDLCYHPTMMSDVDRFSEASNIRRYHDGEDVVVCGVSSIIMEALEAGVTVKQIIIDPDDKFFEHDYRSIDKNYDGNLCVLSLLKERNNCLIDYSGKVEIMDIITTEIH